MALEQESHLRVLRSETHNCSPTSGGLLKGRGEDPGDRRRRPRHHQGSEEGVLHRVHPGDLVIFQCAMLHLRRDADGIQSRLL